MLDSERKSTNLVVLFKVISEDLVKQTLGGY